MEVLDAAYVVFFVEIEGVDWKDEHSFVVL